MRERLPTITVRTSVVLAAALAGLLLSAGLLWLSDVPLGVPGEWTWTRIPFSAETGWGWLLAGFIAAVYVAFVAWGGARLERGRITRALWPAALCVAAFAWLSTVQSAVPGIAGLPKSHFVLFYPGSSGYFWQARYEIRDTREFLAGYEELLAERDYLHIGTHPPGLTLYFRGLLTVLRAAPGLVDAALATEPQVVREAAATIRASQAGSGRDFNRTDEACLWLTALLAQLAAAATVIPLYHLLCGYFDRSTAWYAAACWPLVPAVAIFLPKSDAVYPLIATLGPALWFRGWRENSVASCCLAGATLLAGMLLSLAIAPVAVIAGLATLLEETLWRGDRMPPRWSTCAWRVGAAAAGFFLPCLWLWWEFDLNLPRVWSWNASNHALFYVHMPRTWWKWFLVSPVEVAFAVGAPLAVAAVIGAFRSGTTRARPAIWALGIVWGLLWVSGKNMGEAARLWLLLMPWLLVPAAAALDPSGPGTVPPASRRAWIVLLILQSTASILTVTRVDGFHLAVP